MEKVPTEVFTNFFIHLSSREMVRAREISKNWSEIINSERSLWRRISLLKVEPDGKFLNKLSETNRTKDGIDDRIHQVFTLFDERSHQALIEVTLQLKENLDRPSRTKDKLLEILENSKGTIQTVILDIVVEKDQVRDLFSNLPWKFPNLLDFRLTNSSTKLHYLKDFNVYLKRKPLKENRSTIQLSNSSSNQQSLQVLWLFNCVNLNNLSLLNNLSSLSIEECLSNETWRDLLIVPSKKLKHLRIGFLEEVESDEDEDESQSEILDLDFPNLQVLEILEANEYPKWLKIPSNSTLILQRFVLDGLPSVSQLWLKGLEWWDNLMLKCPKLETLVLSINPSWLLFPRSSQVVLSLLRARRSNKMEGIEMTPIKRLILSFKDFSPIDLGEFGELVEELVDIDQVPFIIEIEI